MINLDQPVAAPVGELMTIGSGAGAAVLFATISPTAGVPLTAADFVVT